MQETLFNASFLAHAGHDHTFSIGGQWHHLIWIAATVAIVAGLVYSFLRKRSR